MVLLTFAQVGIAREKFAKETPHISELQQKVGPVEPVGVEAVLYTDEDKLFYVKRMWAEGLTPTAASRLWGVSSHRTLAAWEKEALGGGWRSRRRGSQGPASASSTPATPRRPRC